jgi:hypothetical protein
MSEPGAIALWVGGRQGASRDGGEQRRHFKPAGFARPRAVRAYARPRLERSPKGDGAKSENGGEEVRQIYVLTVLGCVLMII